MTNMRYNTYLVMDKSKGVDSTLARGMNLDTACSLVKALFEAHPEESDSSYEIIREPELPHAEICDDDHEIGDSYDELNDKISNPGKKYILTGAIHTDGDFRIDGSMISDEYHDGNIHHVLGSEEYSISLETDDKNYIVKFLEELMVSVRTSPIHHHILPKFYTLVNTILESLLAEKDEYSYIGGNYEGTELYLRITD